MVYDATNIMVCDFRLFSDFVGSCLSIVIFPPFSQYVLDADLSLNGMQVGLLVQIGLARSRCG